jgi:hypothetical protein
MFVSLASYQLGNQSHEPDLPRDVETADVGLRAIEGDDDWALVEVKGDNSPETSEESREDLSELELVINTILHYFSSETSEESTEDLPEIELVISTNVHYFSSDTSVSAPSVSGDNDPPRLHLFQAVWLVRRGRRSTVHATPQQRQAVALPVHLQREKECVQLRSAQKLRQRRSAQLLKRNHLDRNNKAREINSRNQRKRRSDRMQHHSGAICNRKC